MNIVDFHDLVMYYIVLMLIIIGILLYLIIKSYSKKRISVRNKEYESVYIIEVILILIPSIILLLIGVPSIWLLYWSEELTSGIITLKVIGLQWYWRYIINDIIGSEVMIDSYTLSDSDVELFRLIEVDNKLVLPVRKSIRIILTSVDVILSFSVPSLGIRTDCIPSRISYTTLYILRESLYVGNCTELCGQGLSNMNILIEGTNSTSFLNWLIANSA